MSIKQVPNIIYVLNIKSKKGTVNSAYVYNQDHTGNKLPVEDLIERTRKNTSFPCEVYYSGEYAIVGDDWEWHREDGPCFFAPTYNVWFRNGKSIQKELEEWAREMDIDLNNLDETDLALIKLKWYS